MKKFTRIFILLVSIVIFSSPSYSQWTELIESTNVDTFYVDYDRIRKHDGYVYFWDLVNYLKPTSLGDLSSKVYNQGDCKLFRFKRLSYVHHKQPMGQGTGASNSPKNPEWRYPPPNSVDEFMLKSVCSR